MLSNKKIIAQLKKIAGIIKIGWFLFWKYPNAIACYPRVIAWLVLNVRYETRINELVPYLLKQKYITSKKLVIKSLLDSYYQTPFNQRVFLRHYIKGFYLVPETSAKLKKSQRRNDLCNCGSGKKFKHCCYKKY